MPINSYKMGPGTLKFGVAGVMDVTLQVTNCRVEPSESVKRTDAVPTLGGTEIPAEETGDLTYRLKGNVVQDLAAAGVIAYTWTNAGASIVFEFIPNTVAARKVTGTVRMVPLTIGGAVSKTERPKSDFDFAVVGVPVFAAAP